MRRWGRRIGRGIRLSVGWPLAMVAIVTTPPVLIPLLSGADLIADWPRFVFFVIAVGVVVAQLGRVNLPAAGLVAWMFTRNVLNGLPPHSMEAFTAVWVGALILAAAAHDRAA